MEVDGLWNNYTYAAVAIAGLVLYFFYTYVTLLNNIVHTF